ncbi:MAG: DsrE/DsrF/TusD sulfur relay family protein [Candidatus Limnocylindria bacterium]
MKTLLILNDAPYGSERSYNGLRLAMSLIKREGQAVRVFLLGDGVACAVRGQKTPDGYYNIERMVRAIAQGGGKIVCCGSCSDARGLIDEARVEGAERSSMDELTDWTIWADRVIAF